MSKCEEVLQTMETRPVVPDRKLLARLVLIREEARNMMGGGILDERNDRGFTTLPESEVCETNYHVHYAVFMNVIETLKYNDLLHVIAKQVNFLTKLVALKPGKTVQQMIQNVMQGKDEGADDLSNEDESPTQGRRQSGLNGRVSMMH